MSPRPSEALDAFLTELTDLTAKYGFVIRGGVNSFGDEEAVLIKGNGVIRDLVHDGERYDAY